MQPTTGFQLLPGQVYIDAVRIPLQVRKGRQGKLRIGFEGSRMWLETPSGSLTEPGTTFLRARSRWIKRSYLLQQRREIQQAYLLNHATHETLLFGKPTPIKFEVGHTLYFRYHDGQLHITLTPEHANRRATCTLAVLKAYAKHYLENRVGYWSQVLKLRYNDVRVKDHRSKWGSCSSRRNINLNWYLILLDKSLIDYVIVHEFMHLKEMNHSPRFWALVEDVLPDYRVRMAELRRHEWVIGAYQALEG